MYCIIYKTLEVNKLFKFCFNFHSFWHNNDAEPIVYVRPAELQMQRLSIPLAVTLQLKRWAVYFCSSSPAFLYGLQTCSHFREQWTLSLHSTLDDWYTYKFVTVDSSIVINNILKPGSLDELFTWLKKCEADGIAFWHHEDRRWMVLILLLPHLSQTLCHCVCSSCCTN